jgi:hypothetical protein
MEAVRKLDTFHIEHVQWVNNRGTNELTQQTYGYEVRQGKFYVEKRSRVRDILEANEVKGMSAREEIIDGCASGD